MAVKFPILQYSDAELLMVQKYLDFSSDDFFDAFCVFQYLAARSVRRFGRDSDESFLFASVGRNIYDKCRFSARFDDLKQKHNFVTIFDVCRHGSKLAAHEFKGL